MCIVWRRGVICLVNYTELGLNRLTFKTGGLFVSMYVFACTFLFVRVCWFETKRNSLTGCGWPLKEPLFVMRHKSNLLAAGVLGDSLGSLRDSVLGKLSWEKETDSSLDFPAGDGWPSVVVGQTGSLSGDTLEDVVDKGVHDGHGFAADSSVGVHLLQHLVDVDSVWLSPPPPLLLVPSTLGFSLGGCLFGSFACWLGWHGFGWCEWGADRCLGLYSTARAVLSNKRF